MPNQTAESITHLCVDQVTVRHGVTECLPSNRRQNLLSMLIQEVCKLVGATMINRSGYNPQCNGLIEICWQKVWVSMRETGISFCPINCLHTELQFKTLHRPPHFLLNCREPVVAAETALVNQGQSIKWMSLPTAMNMSDAWAMA